MITIHTRPIRTHPRSSMRAALSSQYCMRGQLLVRHLSNAQNNGLTNGEFFTYQEGQHCVRCRECSYKQEGKSRLHLPEEVKIIKTKDGRRWRTSYMEAELAGDILEIRDGLGKIVDSQVFKSKV